MNKDIEEMISQMEKIREFNPKFGFTGRIGYASLDEAYYWDESLESGGINEVQS